MTEDAFHDRRITALDALLGASAGVEARLHCVFVRHGISGIDFDVLIRLARDPHRAMRMGDLATESWLSTSGVTRVIDRLEKGGLVRRETCVGDRRALMAVLTDQGEQRLREVLPDLLPAVEQAFADLAETERTALVNSLIRVRDRTRDAEPEHP